MVKKNHKKQEEPENNSEERDFPSTEQKLQETTEGEAQEAMPELEEPEVKAAPSPSGGAWHKRFWRWVLTHKKISISVAAVAVLAVLAALPFTRYLLVGTVLRQSFPVIVVDAETGKPVSSANVELAGQKATTNNEGRADVRTNVGYAVLKISKKYYVDTTRDVLIPIGKPASPLEVKLKAEGRAVPITIVNKISKKPVSNITIAGEDTEAKTDDEGKATLVVPADKQEIKVTLSGDGFNNAEATLKVTGDEVPENTLEITPSGKIYFLSNATGTIDLVKSNLDGTERETVLPGTGKEDAGNTVLVASRDWKHIALLSKRDGGEFPKLFLIETDTNKATVMDEGEATFSLYGWSNNRFVYRVTREKLQYWEPKRHALKSYDATSKKITKLDETAGEGSGSGGYANEDISYVFVIDQEVLYVKNWSGWGPFINGKQATLNSIRADGSQKKTVKSYGNDYSQIALRRGEFKELYIRYYTQNGPNEYKAAFDEYKDGKIAASDITETDFSNKSYPTYAVSPSGNKTLWSDYRDGKYVFFVGDSNGENGKEIGRSDKFTVYGWFSDDYVLLTKDRSEMFILPAGSPQEDLEKALKISDYYKPDYSNLGFGYGYGG